MDRDDDPTRRYRTRAARWREVWGSGTGPIARLAPPSRIVAGAALLGACLAAPAATLAGLSVVAVVLLGWTAGCRPPWGAARAALVFGLVLFLPYFLLVPLLPPEATESAPGWRGLLVVPWSVLVHGLSGLLVSVWTATTLTPSDLREGLARLPVPRIVSAILLQIVHQTGALIDEGGRVASAMAVRGASGRGLAAWRVLRSLPRVWLPRVLGRAERVAAAMEVRGFSEESFRPVRTVALGLADGIVLVLALGLLGCALAARLGGTP